MNDRVGVLFVCLGNICRSPLAEGVFRALTDRAGLSDRFRIDSAGTSDYHIGESPDSRTVHVAAARGVALEHSARQLRPQDLSEFDYVVAMDADNLGRIRGVAQDQGGAAEVRLLRSYDPAAGDDLEVPDPYFGGGRGFEEVHEIVERACAGLLSRLREQHGI